MAAEAGPTGRDAGGESPTVVSSPDGRSFRLRTSAEAGLRPGDYVTIADGSGAEHLGYVESVDEVTETTTWAAGSIMPGPITPAPFRSGSARRSDAAAVRRFFAASGAALPVGTLVDDPEVPVGLIPKRINRHTFWCGQSGSGKTYALGVALEQILLHTRLPMVIFDPNSDFVRLGETLPHVGPEVAGQLADRPVRVLRRGSGPDALRARLRSMDLASRGALLRLDPVLHRDEFNAMVHHQFDPSPYSEHGDFDAHAFAQAFLDSDDPGARALGRRLENLGLLDWEIWALDRPSASEIIAERPAATVLDLGSLERQDEQLDDRPERAHRPVGPPGGAPTDPAGHRRGAQPVLTGPGVPARPCGAAADHPDRRRGPQVRPVAAALHPAAVQGPPRGSSPSATTSP